MADMKKLAEEQLEEITGGIILSRINEPSFQEKLINMDDARLKIALSGLSPFQLQELTGFIRSDALRGKIISLI